MPSRKSCGEPEECKHDDGPVDPIPLDAIVEDFLVRTRRLMLVGEIDERTSAHICSFLQVFSLEDGPIYMYINSPGGSLSDGYAIIDQMIACPNPIHTIVRGQAHSMGAIIAAFGEKGHRYAMSNSSLMVHSPTIFNPPCTIEQHEKMFDFTTIDYTQKMRGLAKQLGVTKKRLLELMAETRWMVPKQAMQIGLIDGIWTPKMEREINRSRLR